MGVGWGVIICLVWALIRNGIIKRNVLTAYTHKQVNIEKLSIGYQFKKNMTASNKAPTLKFFEVARYHIRLAISLSYSILGLIVV